LTPLDELENALNSGPCANLSAPATTTTLVNAHGDLMGPPLSPALREEQEVPELVRPNQFAVDVDDTLDKYNEIENSPPDEQHEEGLEEETVGNFTLTNGRGGLAERHVLPAEQQPEQQHQCGGSAVTDNALKNVTLVNILIIVLLIVVIVANINEGEKKGSGIEMFRKPSRA
jgi:hypothetical protein